MANYYITRLAQTFANTYHTLEKVTSNGKRQAKEIKIATVKVNLKLLGHAVGVKTPRYHCHSAFIWKCSPGSHEIVQQSMARKDYYIISSDILHRAIQ